MSSGRKERRGELEHGHRDFDREGQRQEGGDRGTGQKPTELPWSSAGPGARHLQVGKGLQGPLT